MNNYVRGRSAEQARLDWLGNKGIAIIGGRFRGSKISKAWIRRLGFNPKIDLWYVDKNHNFHFEQYKYSGKQKNGKKPNARIDKEEIQCVQGFADIFHNNPSVWVGYVTKNYRQKPKEVRLN